MHPQRRHLAPPQPGVGQEQHHKPILGRDCLGKVVHLLMCQEPLFSLTYARQ
jgi:hypothetical protein